MSAVVELLRSRRVPQIAVLALMSVGFAGCSADMSTRLSQNSYSENPFAFDPQPTGGVAAQPAGRRELPQYARPQSPQYQSQPLPPPAVAAPQSYPAANSGVSGGGPGSVSYAPPAHPPIEAHGYSKIGPGPMAAIRFKWTVRLQNGDYYVDETIGENSAPIASGPMSREAAIQMVDDRESDARRRFEQLRSEMSGRGGAADLAHKNGGRA
jgi:hypothetical protein